MITYQGKQIERALAPIAAGDGEAAEAAREALEAARALDVFAVDASAASDAAGFDAEREFEHGRAAGFKEGFKEGVDITRRLLA